MNITVTNVEVEFLEIIQSRIDHKGKEVSFIDWTPTHINDEAVASQIQEIKRCQDKQIPVIVFDRYSAMNDSEILFLHKNAKVSLLEPSVVTRPGFEFMPYWVHFKEFDYRSFQDDRRFQTGYKGDMFTNDLEANILSIIKDKVSVGLDVKLPQEKYDILKSVICIDNFGYSDFCTMILTDTQDGYSSGRLPDIRELMYNGTVPMLYHKHKWLHSLFKNFVVYDAGDIRWLVRLYKNCGCGFLEDIQKNILEYLPEMEAGNFVDSLLEKAKRI